TQSDSGSIRSGNCPVFRRRRHLFACSPTFRGRGNQTMNILLYRPDNGVTRNFMPHLWMFLLKALTPAGHEVFLIDGNAQPMTENEVAQFVRAHNIQLVAISAMTRMAARAYRMADAIRSTGAKGVFGG